MKSVILAGVLMALGFNAQASDGSAAAPGDKVIEQASGELGKGTAKGQIVVGETLLIKLSCNPTTGYQWELKSINKKIAAPQGPVEFQETPAARPGMVGVGGSCVLKLKGLKPGKTKLVMVYRREWEKKAPDQTFKAEITVVIKK